MGKRTRKTRWRTLNIDEQSDSEESTGNPLQLTAKHKSYHSRLSYSSQSTPTRRHPQDAAKSTRSSSTASETKVTFNEDEYTRITTPRQDVLFKKGYLNKPRTYQTQTSTGTTTTSASNSTGNGTPDHQSADGAEGADLEYESQFVFPNGFVDQNGIYYINGFEPFPVVVYNTAICYPEFQDVRQKRHSTGSLTESTSPNNEETTTSGAESCGPPAAPVYLYPGYYYPHDDTIPVEPRVAKKKRRRKLSAKTSASSTDDEQPQEEDDAEPQPPTSVHPELKPDAEEFVPRAYRDPPLHYLPNLVPILPPQFVPLGYVPAPPPIPHVAQEKPPETSPTPPSVPVVEKPIDIEKIVSKLEEAAREQRQRPRGRFQSGKSRRKEDAAPVPPPAVPPSPPKKPQPSPTQWISVGRKRRNRNKQEVEEEEEKQEERPDDGFESYDVSQLVDVVPPRKEAEEPPEAVEEKPKPKPKRQQKPSKEEPQVEPPPPPPAVPQEPEKKPSKKKRKKKPLSVSSSSTTINLDDSYDFLLEAAVSEEKTNVEVSRELDRMIQRGIYTALEEKIRDCGLRDDGFFKALQETPPASVPEKNGFFKDVSPMGKKPGIFLENPKVEELLVEESKPAAYPITRAVKEWMTRTRETTPEVEILKSPSAILRERDLLERWDDDLQGSHVSESEEAVETTDCCKATAADRRAGMAKHNDLPYRAICCSVM